MSETDPDLTDVFRLLYADEDDWGTFEDDEARPPSLGRLAPEVDVELVESDLEDQPNPRYTREYFKSALDSLLDHRVDQTRVFPTQSTPKTAFNSVDPIPPAPIGYAPYSYLSLLARLQTFKASTFSPHPEPLTPVQLALKGWRNDGREMLTCGECQGSWNLSSLGDIKDDSVRREVARRLGSGSRNRHVQECPWSAKSSPDDQYTSIRPSLHPMTTHSLASLAAALESSIIEGLRWTSPLTSSQLVALTTQLFSDYERSTSSLRNTASALAFFAWYPYNPKQSSIDVNSTPKSTDIVCCRICRRRVGLWSCSKRDSLTSFDLLSEHLSWCPIRDGKWWNDVEMLKEKKRGIEATFDKDWARVSEKLGEKSWRKRRKRVD